MSDTAYLSNSGASTAGPLVSVAQSVPVTRESYRALDGDPRGTPYASKEIGLDLLQYWRILTASYHYASTRMSYEVMIDTKAAYSLLSRPSDKARTASAET
jgi:hypothetical protein